MRTKFESLPNEILLIVLANLSSLELLTSLWWLNKRVDVLVCSILSRVDNRLNSGLAIIEPGLTFNECHSLLFHSISTLHFGLQRIYFDGTNYIASDLSYELLFDNDKNILRFPNLKSIVLTGCFLIKSLIKSLSVLIKHQLNELVLTFDEDVLNPLQKCNAFDELRKDALNTVEYAEFKISGCHRDSNELIRIGKSLVPFLSTYMPHLQTLCLWRPDDFPWTSIRPDYKKRGYSYGGLIRRWNDKLQTSESIKKHAIIFEEDLCELVEQMKDLIFLDIHGEIHEEKVEPYRSMVQALFLYNRSDIGMFRFRLWL
ncbi:unnamed protein product [Rotaria magnacalcarata]